MRFFGRTYERVDNVDPTGKNTGDFLDKAVAAESRVAAANHAAQQKYLAADAKRRRDEAKNIAAMLNAAGQQEEL